MVYFHISGHHYDNNKFWDEEALARGSHDNCVSVKLHTTLALIVKQNERLRLVSLVAKGKQQRMELLTNDYNYTISDGQDDNSDEEEIVVRPKEMVVVLIMFTMLIVSVYR